MPPLPSGTVTFLLTDIEDSSTQWEQDPEDMRAALAVHDDVVQRAVAAHDGVVVKHMGDGCWAAFSAAPDAARAAIEMQRHLQATPSNLRAQLRVRVGLHTGEVEPTEDDYFGPVPNRSSRVANLANGNQIVCSSSTAGLLGGFDLATQGLHDLRGIGTDEIFLITADGVETDPRPIRRPVAPTNLPQVHTSFLGRSTEVTETVGFLEKDRSVVTLLGPGGVGKTRLSLEVGAQLAQGSIGTVQFCDLAPLAESPDVAVAVAEVVGARRQPGMTLVESIADYLDALNVLIILDNCEHLIDAVCALVGPLSDVPGVRILATSREALGIQGEQLVTIAPLDPRTSGVDLFVDRARQRDAGFELDDTNRDDVHEIVRRLDGIPLAIELAAARIRLMTPAQLAERLDDRFRLLGGGRRRERHETLRATVSWSFKLLSPAEVALFTRLCVFAGGFSLDAVEAVCADDDLISVEDVPDLVLALVDKSMVVSRAQLGSQRFTMLETLRRFGEEELGESGEGAHFRRRHAGFFLDLARRQNDRLFTAAEPDAWAVLDREWPNLRTAHDTFQLESDVDSTAELILALVWYATMSMRHEIFEWANEAIVEGATDADQYYTDLFGAAAVGAYFTMVGDSRALATAGLARDPSDPMGFCRTALCAVHLNNLHTKEASDVITAAWLETNPTSVGSRLWAEGFRTFHLCLHDPSPEAAVHAGVMSTIARDTGSVTAHALTAWAQGQVVSLTDVDAAMAVWSKGLEWSRSLNQSHLLEHVINGLLLHFTARRGQLDEVIQLCLDAVRAATEHHYFAGASHLFGVTSIALARAGDPDTGAMLIGAMRGNGHEPRRNAVKVLADALGSSFEAKTLPGRALSVSGASQLAIEALEQAKQRVAEPEAAT